MPHHLRIISSGGHLLARPDDPGPRKAASSEHAANVEKYRPRWYHDLGKKVVLVIVAILSLPIIAAEWLRDMFTDQ